MNLRVMFHLDGSGIYIDPSEPIHLDSLIAAVVARRRRLPALSRHSQPSDIPLPLHQRDVHGHVVWCASALTPAGPVADDIQQWRKRLPIARLAATRGSPNRTMGAYRDWNMPVPLTLCTRLVGYASGNRRELRKLLREITHLGKKRAHGHGKVCGLTVEACEHDWSHSREGRATRYLPHPNGPRHIRPQPPYWHPSRRVPSIAVGDPIY